MNNQISLFFREDDNLIFAKNLKEFYYVLNDGLDIFKLCSDVFYRLYVESIKMGQKLYDLLLREGDFEKVDAESFSSDLVEYQLSWNCFDIYIYNILDKGWTWSYI